MWANGLPRPHDDAWWWWWWWWWRNSYSYSLRGQLPEDQWNQILSSDEIDDTWIKSCRLWTLRKPRQSWSWLRWMIICGYVWEAQNQLQVSSDMYNRSHVMIVSTTDSEKLCKVNCMLITVYFIIYLKCLVSWTSKLNYLIDETSHVHQSVHGPPLASTVSSENFERRWTKHSAPIV